MEEKEKEINLTDMCVKVLLKWKWMLLWGIVLSMIFAGIKYAKDTINYTKPEDTEAVLTSMKDEMTPGEYSNVSTYISLYESLDELKKNRDSRLIYQIDPYHEKTLYMVYAISLPDIATSRNSDGTIIAEHLNDEIKINQIASIYSNYILDEYVIRAILEVVPNISENDMRTLVSGWNANGLVYIQVIYTDDMDIEKIAEVIKANLEQYSIDVKQDEEHEFTLINEYCSEVIDDGLINTQSSLTSREYNLQAQLNSIGNTLSDSDKEYISIYIEDKDLENTDSITDDKPSGVSKKMILLGFVFGVFLVCAWELLKYVLSGKLHTDDVLSEYFGLRLYGIQNIMETEKSKKRINNWIYKLANHNHKALSCDEQKEIILSGIRLYCKQNNIEQVVFTGTDIEDIDEKYITELQDGLKESGIIAKVEKNINYYPEALQRTAEVGNIVLFETIEKSIETEIENILMKAGEYNIIVLGAVAFTNV